MPPCARALSGHCDADIEGINCRECRLSRLELPRRKLDGTIPSSLSLLQKLSTFDLSHNRLSGTLPTQMGLLGKLATFNLDSNRISGTLPTQIGLLGRNARHGYTTKGILHGASQGGSWLTVRAAAPPTPPADDLLIRSCGMRER